MSMETVFRFGADEDQKHFIEHEGRKYSLKEIVGLKLGEYIWRKGKIVGITLKHELRNCKLHFKEII